MSSSFSVLLGGVIVFCCIIFSWVIVVRLRGGMERMPFVLVILFVAGFRVVGVFTMGLFSGGVYRVVGVLRSVAQMISYEVVIGLLLLIVVFSSVSIFRLSGVVGLVLFLYFPLLLIGVIIEVNRTPVDFMEGESELVSGGVTELGGLVFAFMFLGEYGFIRVYSILISYLLLGSFRFVLIFLVVYVFSWLRLSLPRFRYDLLMLLRWKILIPAVMISMLVEWGLV
ncbi:hypothetical protein ACOME3_010355 [Neoechinorhynchus agilis]